MKPIYTIDDVISNLDTIIEESILDHNPLGYFAALYRKVTVKVKEGILSNFFDDGSRMEKLDVIFASRYLHAYFAYKNQQPTTESWKKAFDVSKKYWPIVLQHLLMGMNAHINLDLGIATAEVAKDQNIEDLKDDFNKINEILSSLVLEVERDLAEIWPTWHKILKLTRNIDDFLIDFSMEIARDGAWKFANNIADSSEDQLQKHIEERDEKVIKNANFITNPGWIVKLVMGVIRLGELGSVADKIKDLKN
ncbi:DUF5995 family protein [Aquimarina sp. RZ0]|uniref:DUF5995 family protein n=1 Tax=Aquimarina sp. RZ0 TaxID=2607730 RepID=UPI0011F37C86|nr:DUF5995 family protein [Aquimarina sp. RZ0]KAA1242749.1 hypothetical protein F0000_24270 [Aquimarina sp. RZ0]